MICGYCGEEYNPGPPAGELFIYHPDGVAYYWKHTRDSQHHQEICKQLAQSQQQMLTELPAILKKAAYQRAKIARKKKKEEARDSKG